MHRPIPQRSQHRVFTRALRLGVALVLFLSLDSVWAGPVFDALPSDLQSRIERGELVSTERVGPEFWPEISLYQQLNLTPEETLAVLADIPLQKTYLKGLIRSDVLAHLGRGVLRAGYTAAIRDPIGNEDFTLEHSFSFDSKTQSYVDVAKLTQARLLGRGSLLFVAEPFGSGTLLYVKAHVTVKGPLGQVVKKEVHGGMRKVFTALADQMRLEKAELPELLSRQRSELQQILSGP